MLEKDGSWKGKQRIVLPAFDLHNKEVGHGNGMQRVTTIAYEIRTSPVNAAVLKNLLCKISMDASNDLKFIPYGLISVAGKDTMKHIIMQQNKFIEEMAIVVIQGIDHKKEDEVKDLFSKSLHFTGMERTRKFEEGRYLLITTKVNLHQAQQEADHLLRKYFPEMKNPTTNNSRPSRVSPKIKHTHFSSYLSALSQEVKEPVEIKYSYPPLSQRRPVSISFPTNEQYAINPTPTQKRKLFNDTSSASTVQTTDTKTTAKSTMFQPTVSTYETPPTSWKSEVTEMMGEMKVDITKSIHSLIKDQMKGEMKSMMKEMKDQMMGLMKEVIREELPTMISNNNNTVPEEKDSTETREDEWDETWENCDEFDEMEEENEETNDNRALSDDEEADLYTESIKKKEKKKKKTPIKKNTQRKTSIRRSKQV